MKITENLSYFNQRGIPGIDYISVMNKMFALTGLEGDPPYLNLKCDPDRAIELRGQYETIQPGYHMNKVNV
jgi:predicted DNA-binding protein (MmcQ/YjbR family)